MKLLEHLPFETDAGVASRGRVGVIVLSSDYTIEHEWRHIFAHAPGLALYHSRIFNDDRITPESLRAMEPRITACTQTFLPGTDMDVVAYGCTSASMAIGEETVFERIRAGQPNAACTTPITAAFAAFTAFDAQRIAVLTPYQSDVNAIVADYIRARGFEVPVFGSFNEPSDAVVARISPGSLESAIRSITSQAQVDAVFVSCTSLRLAGSVQSIEASLGLPVTSSNHAMAWHAMRLAGIDDRLDGLGSLFALPLGKITGSDCLRRALP